MLSKQHVARWTFYFEEGHIASDVSVDCEDERISNCVEIPHGIFKLPGETLDLWVNMDRVKCVSRQEVDILEPVATNVES